MKPTLFSKDFIFVGILMVVVVAFIAIPNFIKARSTPCCNACVNNLRQLDAAANQFALEHQLTNGDRIRFPNDLTPYIKLNAKGEIPPCPAGGHYFIRRVGEAPTCSLGSTVTPSHLLP